MSIVKKLHIAATSIALALMASCPAAAIEPIAALPKPEEVRRVTLGFYGLHIDTYAPVSVAQIVDSGCVYATEPGSDKNRELLAILEDGLELTDRGPHRFRLRTVINVHLNDDSVFSLLISDAHNLTPGVFGTVDHEVRNAQGFLRSNEAMLVALRTWARNNLEPRAQNSHC